MSTQNVIEKNKALVSEFYELALNQRNYDRASRYLGEYKQHNPLIEDGAEGLKKYLRWIEDNYPKSHSQVFRIFADGDTVILHVHRVRTAGTRGDAIVDLFRVQDGKITEHWDVIQPVPESTANGNSMFY